MNLTVYIDSESTKDLEKYAALEKKSRNALIREAIHEWLDRRNATKQWSKAIMEFEGMPDFESFEAGRKVLFQPADGAFP